MQFSGPARYDATNQSKLFRHDFRAIHVCSMMILSPLETFCLLVSLPCIETAAILTMMPELSHYSATGSSLEIVSSLETLGSMWLHRPHICGLQN